MKSLLDSLSEAMSEVFSGVPTRPATDHENNLLRAYAHGYASIILRNAGKRISKMELRVKQGKKLSRSDIRELMKKELYALSREEKKLCKEFAKNL